MKAVLLVQRACLTSVTLHRPTIPSVHDSGCCECLTVRSLRTAKCCAARRDAASGAGGSLCRKAFAKIDHVGFEGETFITHRLPGRVGRSSLRQRRSKI
ncbi:hypothetical protein D3C86_1830280 [compost metagenome]